MLNRFIKINRRLLLMGNSATKAKNKYNKAVYDQISIKPTKGTKSLWQSEAEKHGENLTEYITNAVKMRMESETEQNVQELSETDILNNAFMKIAESCQKLLSAHLDLIDLFPYDENNEDDDDNGEIKSPYNETIKRYLLGLISYDINKIWKFCNSNGLKKDIKEKLDDISDDISDFNSHIATNDLEEYLIEFNEMMGI